MRFRWLAATCVFGLGGLGGLAGLAGLTGLAVATASPQPQLATTADPMPPEQPGSASTLDPKHILTLTDDPVVGKAHAISGEEHPGVVAFTFDDGPNPDTSPTVIDALEKYDIPATFFIITQNITGRSAHAVASRAVLAREIDRGFLIGDHSTTHPNLRNADGDTLEREIDGSLRTLAMTAQRPIAMFRPPYGALGGAGRVRLAKLGVTEVQWSIDTLDWRARDAERLRKKVFKMIVDQNGGVVLMHDRVRLTADIIAHVLDDLEAENCRRLSDGGKPPIWPVSIHYFLREHDKTARAIPKDVEARTAAYQAELPNRCHVRNDPAGS